MVWQRCAKDALAVWPNDLASFSGEANINILFPSTLVHLFTDHFIFGNLCSTKYTNISSFNIPLHIKRGIVIFSSPCAYLKGKINFLRGSFARIGYPRLVPSAEFLRAFCLWTPEPNPLIIFLFLCPLEIFFF